MKQSSSLWQWAGFGIVTLGGTILHFLYEWTGGSILTAPFSAINESTWEHMKLMYWPLLLFALIQRPFFRYQPNYWCVKLAQILTALVLIPLLFYTYNGAFGESPDWVNIAVFYLSAGGAFWLERLLFRLNTRNCHSMLAITAIALIGLMFVVFTFAPPQIPLFLSPG